MDETAHDSLFGELLKVSARLAQLDAAQRDRADSKLAADEMIQRHAACDDVAPACAGIKLNSVIALERFDRLDLDQGDLAG